MDSTMALLSAGAATREAPRISDAERELIERARALQPAAWDALFAAHFTAIYRYAFYRVGDRQAAEDLAADVFVAAMRGIGRYTYRGTSIRAWLYRIAHNLTADHLRRDARSALPVAISPSASADHAPWVEDRRDIDVALRQLTPEQQQVVVLRFFEGLPIAQVAATMHTTDGAVKALQHRAITRLRAILEGGDG